MRAFLKSFTYAAKGVGRAVRYERNFRFHLCIAAYVYVLSAFYSFTLMQYVVLTLIVVGVLALELVNSAIEAAVDGAIKETSPMAGAAKDMAAGAVLVFSIGAVVCGVLLFWDLEVFAAIAGWFGKQPFMLLPLAISIVFCAWFVFIFGKNKDK